MAEARTDEVACSFCLEFGRYLTRPRSLPCGHYYCEPCLQSNLESNKIVSCPRCNTVYDVKIESLPLADLSESTTPIWCDVCQKKGERNKAKSYCTECRKCLCTQHLQWHDDLNEDHKKLSVGEYRQQLGKLETRKCMRHTGQTYITGCRSCLSVFCVKCMTEKTTCDGDSLHETMMLDDLVKYLEGQVNGLRKEAYSFDTALSALIKKCTNILDEQKTETDKMLQVLHDARDEQIAEIRAKYALLETELREKREKTHTEIQDFMDNKLGVIFSDLRRELKLTEARLRDNHQVDIVMRFRETEKLIRHLMTEQIPSLKVDHVINIQPTRHQRDIEVKITPSSPISISTDVDLLSQSPSPAPVKPPTKLTLIRKFRMPASCVTVSKYQDCTYVGLGDGRIMRLGQDSAVTQFATVTGAMYGMAIDRGLLYTVSGDQNLQSVNVFNLNTSKHVRSWNITDTVGYYCSKLVVVGNQVVIADIANKVLCVYTLTGQLVKQIPCQQITGGTVCMSTADNHSIILSDYESERVYKISITSRKVLWESDCVVKPMGVTCFNNQYVLVYGGAADREKIHVLEINTGNQVGVLDLEITGSVYDLHVTAGDTLIVPYFWDSAVHHYKLK